MRRRGGRLLLVLPDAVAGHLADAELDVTDALEDARAQLLLKPEGEETDWIVPVEATVDVPEAAEEEPVRVTATVRGADRPDDRGRRDRAARPGRRTTCARSSGSPASARTRSCSTGAGRASSRSTPEERIFVAGEVPAPPPERTPRERLRFGLGRLRLRARGPRAAA